MHTYKYFDNTEFLITDECKKEYPYTFLDNHQLWESEQIKFFYDLIKDTNNINILDIGAQVGLYSLYAKKLKNVNFYAFEPFPLSYKILNDNLKLNNIENVKTFNIALSDKKGKTNFQCCSTHYGLHTIGNKPVRFDSNNSYSIEIETNTIDELFASTPIHYIKIDTEGWEYFILRGGKNTILKYKPIIQIEYNIINMQQCNVTEEMINEILNELNYYIVKNNDGEEVYLFPKKEM